MSFVIESTMTPCIAQPKWVKEVMTASDTITTDDAASEITLFESVSVRIQDDGVSRTHVRRMVKFLKMDKLSGFLSEWITPRRRIEDLNGWQIRSEGGVQKLRDEDFAEISKSPASQYDESHLFLARFPHVGSGDIVAFEYDLEDEDWTHIHQTFLVQQQEPVHFAQYSVQVPVGWEVRTGFWNIPDSAAIRSGDEYAWTFQSLPYRKDEYLMPPWTYMGRKLSVLAFASDGDKPSPFSTWPSVSRWVHELVDSAVDVDDEIRGVVSNIMATEKGQTDRIRAIARYVTEKIRYVAVEIGNGRWHPRPATVTFANRYGDCKDKTTLMRSMLKVAGIPSALVLANSTSYVDPKLPSPFQFNHAIIAIPADALDSLPGLEGATTSGWLFFDPTDHITPFGKLPPSLQGSKVLLEADIDSVLLRLPFSGPEANRRFISARVAIDASASLSAKVRIVEFGSRADHARHLFKTTTQHEQIKAIKTGMFPTFNGLTISEYETGSEGDSAWSMFQLNVPSAITHSDRNILLKPDFFYKEEFPAMPNAPREHPIWFGGPQRVDTEIDIELPRQWKLIEALPSGEFSCAGVSNFSYSLSLRDRVLMVRSRREQTGDLIKRGDYDHVRAFVKELRAYGKLTVHLQSD